MVAPIASNLKLAEAPGNGLLHAAESGLPRDSVIGTSRITSISGRRLEDRVSSVGADVLSVVDHGIRRRFDL